ALVFRSDIDAGNAGQVEFRLWSFDTGVDMDRSRKRTGRNHQRLRRQGNGVGRDDGYRFLRINEDLRLAPSNLRTELRADRAASEQARESRRVEVRDRSVL